MNKNIEYIFIKIIIRIMNEFTSKIIIILEIKGK